MTRLPGHVDLNPAEPRSWMTRIAEIAVLLHSLDLPAKTFRPWTDSWIAPLDGFQVPVDAQKPAVWKAAFGVMAAPPPKDTAVFLHCDLLPVNMLWSRGRITGLTDWNSIHRGSRAIDVGHCRRYLAALYSPEWSEQLRSLYESIAGVTLDPWWDLYALLHYDDSGPKWIRGQVAGRRPVDVPGMTSASRSRSSQRYGASDNCGLLAVDLPVLACRTDPYTKSRSHSHQSPANNETPH